MSFLHSLKSFLPDKMNRQVRELFISTTLVNFALALVVIFEPIYLFQIGYSIHSIMLFYLIAYGLYFFTLPIGGHFASRKGYESGIFIGTIFYIAFYVCLFFIQDFPWLFYVAPIILTAQKTFYWPAWHADFARYSGDTEEGREISGLTVATSIAMIIGPALAGFIILNWGYGALFTLASIVFLASNIPTLATKEVFTPDDFPYRNTYKDLLSKENRRSFFAYLGFGEELAVVVLWPVFISIVITNALNLGLVVAFATFITTAVTFYVGKAVDIRNKRKVLRLGAVFYAISWFLRLFITNAFHVFFVDTLSRLSKNVLGIPLMAITYENAKLLTADRQNQVMKRVVFFELSLVTGKLLAILIIFVATFYISTDLAAFYFIFALSGLTSLLYMLI